MSGSVLPSLRLKLFKLVQLIAPEGSSLDAVFNSYDDWREMREKSSAERAADAAAKQDPRVGSRSSVSR
jgi:hypothetical protein